MSEFNVQVVRLGADGRKILKYVGEDYMLDKNS